MMLAGMALLLVILIALVIAIVSSIAKQTSSHKANLPGMTGTSSGVSGGGSQTEAQSEVELPKRDFSMLEAETVPMSRFFTYGTHFNFDAKIPWVIDLTEPDSTEGAQTDGITQTDGALQSESTAQTGGTVQPDGAVRSAGAGQSDGTVQAPSEGETGDAAETDGQGEGSQEEPELFRSVLLLVFDENAYDLTEPVITVEMDYTWESDVLTVCADQYIDEGLCLEQIPEGEFFLAIAVTDKDANRKLYALFDGSGLEPIEYWTLTRNGTNRRIEIAPREVSDEMGHTFTTFGMIAKQETLPEDIYDIMIDPGHGTCDGGAASEDLGPDGQPYLERDIALEYSFLLKEKLETMGYKVGLTHDGSEGTTSKRWCYWNAYKEGNRVWNTCVARPKYSISLHMNSVTNMTRTRGVEVFSSLRAGTRLAEQISLNIQMDTSMPASGKLASSVEGKPGVFKWALSSDETTDYLYMIREVAGIATGAYVHDSDRYGTNAFYQVNYGPESYLIEMGYISDYDNLQIILREKNEYVTAIAKSVDADIRGFYGE